MTYYALLSLVLTTVLLLPMGTTFGREPDGPFGGIENSIGMKFVAIAAGRYRMGSQNTEPGRDDNETAHEVQLTKGFSLGVYEVTQAQYTRMMGENPSQFSKQGGYQDRVAGIDTRDFPVDSISWKQAVDFCRRLTALPQEKRAGRRYRLPTEAEWEYACRAGSKSIWHFGNEQNRLGDYAWYQANSANRLHRVGSKKPNRWGLYDMYGNCWEWCHDGYAKQYRENENDAVENPQGPDLASSRIIRGGGIYSLPYNCRSAARNHDPPSIGDPDTGFRVVLIAVKSAKNAPRPFCDASKSMLRQLP